MVLSYMLYRHAAANIICFQEERQNDIKTKNNKIINTEIVLDNRSAL